MIKVLECFAGIGACSKALTNLGIEHEIVDAVEIDKFAVKSFNAIHGTNFEPQDITKWDKDIEVDLIMHGSPCQDFSVAGKQAGGDEGSGTRSSLMYETLRIVGKLKPKYVIWENVKNILSKKHRHNFDAYLQAMEEMGYTNYYQVLNAKDYGVPQNRERVFTVSILGGSDFEFPEKEPLTVKLKDVLEDKVDEKYYLSDKMVEGLIKHNNNHKAKGTGFLWKPRNPDGHASCLRANASLAPTDNTIVQVGTLDIKGNDCIKRVYSPKGISPSLTTMQGGNRQPKIVDDTYASREARVYDKFSPTLRASRGGLKVVNDNEVELPVIAASRGRNPDNPSDRTTGCPTEQRLEINAKGVSNTLTSVQKDNYVVEPFRITTVQKDSLVSENVKALRYVRTEYGKQIRKDYENHICSEKRKNMVELQPRTDDLLNTLTTVQKDNYLLCNLRIRKLTPRECWRLMSFSDEDFDKAKAAGISNSQLYKQAGNSIVVKVLEKILTNLLEEEK